MDPLLKVTTGPLNQKGQVLRLFECKSVGRVIQKHVLAGKVISDRVVNMYALKSAISRAWGLGKHLEIKEVDRNIFLFTFEDANERLRGITKGPLNFNGSLLVLKKWLADQTIQDGGLLYV
ncbi:hypothetical protein Tsubulata_000670 [Turnera subulata]|uniref:DUF4283 domain-containing protein n=1 Tax=Turnera subulata TaxID=218843 RepID=A0A9Q0J7P3_9ROSI|nr:hypothetical protein Tsubulata_000670 [Turnera subulata]